MTNVVRMPSNPMHKRPLPGQRIMVLMKDGRDLECHACMVYSDRGSGIVIYHGRKAIDEMQAEGWWYIRRAAAAIGSERG